MVPDVKKVPHECQLLSFIIISTVSDSTGQVL